MINDLIVVIYKNFFRIILKYQILKIKFKFIFFLKYLKNNSLLNL
jgi:hypothetical protein